MDIPGVDIPHEQLVTVLVLLGSNALITILKALKLELSPEGWIKVNGFLSSVIGLGVGMLAQGEPLERVLLAVISAGLSAFASVGIHHAGSTLRAGRQALRTIAANGSPPSGPPDDEREECDAP